MTTADRVLVILLRVGGVGGLLALIAVVMPLSWMDAIHRWLGLGELPTGPIVEYLARSLSLFYALVGGLCLLLASDLERYRPLIRLLGPTIVVMGALALGIDLASGMPWWWTAFEGPPGVPFGALIYWLARDEHTRPRGS
jgi:hypothetical protein